ncbi:MAG TPA: SH3 domain-containing protein [Candidatus Wallbacteria bacterium]|nr:SH3 domain-containing protein [Candidatus Wallbacteria bacterium]
MNKDFFKNQLFTCFAIAFLIFNTPRAFASVNDVLQTISSDSVTNATTTAASGTAVQTSSIVRAILMPGLAGANVRSSSWGDIIGNIPPGKLIEIKGEEGDWYIVEIDGKKGYVLKQALITSTNFKLSSNTPARTGTVKIDKNYMLKVRAGAYGDQIGNLNADDKVQITGEDGDWYKIIFNGETGYVHKKFVQSSSATQTANENNTATNASATSTATASATAVTTQTATTTTTTTTTTPATASVATASSGNQLIDWLQQAGFKGDGLRVAWSVAMRESNGIPNIGKGTKYFNGYDWGLFQLNKPTFGKKSWWDDQKIQDPIYCAKVVFDLTKGGTYWIPWGLSGDGKSMDASCYKMWSAEKQKTCIWEPYKKWYDKYPLK